MPPTKKDIFTVRWAVSESAGNTSLAHPAYQPQGPSMWPDQMPMLSLVFHSHASMPSLRSTPSWLPTAPHNAPLWLLSAAENFQMAWALDGAQ